jgi:outer membrane protein assembly factor BamB
VYSAEDVSRVASIVAILAFAGCAARRPAPKAPLFPLSPSWKTILGDFVVAPLGADGRRIYVATRDGAVRALDPLTGAVLWKSDGFPGRLTAAEGVLLVRGEDGTLWSLQPRTGGVRWRADTGVAGPLPSALDGEQALVAGRGLAAVDLASGRVLWKDEAGAETTAPPVSAGSRLLAGEADGTLRCRDRATGRSLWVLRTGSALVAPPLVDETGRRLYLGTTDRRIVEVALDDGRHGWSWRVGADVACPGLLLPDRVAFASLDAVLHVLRRGGNLDWRGALPSRPLSAPFLVEGYLVVACLENELVAFLPGNGAKAGTFRTKAEIRTAPLVLGNLVLVGLRDRSVIAFAPAGSVPPPEPTPEPSVASPPPGR